jgi:branched-chain amino acid transport system substrate-binding protein
MPNRKLLLLTLILALLIVLVPQGSAIYSQDSATPEATEYTGEWAGTVLFGVPLALTGSLSKEGNLSREGYELWKEVYNKAGGIVVDDKHYQIDTKYYDDESSAQKSATLAEKLIKEDKVNFLLGPYGTSANLQVSTVAEKNQIPMVEGNGVAESIFNQGYEYTFLVASPAQNYLRGAIDMALAQDPKPATVAILSADDPFSVEVAESARAYAEEKGLTVVYFQKYPDKSTDLRAPLTEAKAKTPDLFLNSGHFAESVAIVQQAKELNFEAKGYGFSVGPSLPDFQTTLQADANFVFGGAQWTGDLQYQGSDLFQTSQNYLKMYAERWGHNPAYQSASSTASGIAYIEAIKAANSLDPAAVRDALASLDVMTFYGQIKFDERGMTFYGQIKFDERGVNMTKPMVVEQWQGGKKATIWPADVASAKALWPAPAWGQR